MPDTAPLPSSQGFHINILQQIFARQFPDIALAPRDPYEAGNGHITRDSAVLLRGYGPQNRLSDNHVLPKNAAGYY